MAAQNVNGCYLLLIMYANSLLKFYKSLYHNVDSIVENTIFVSEIVPNNYLNVTNMDYNFNLECLGFYIVHGHSPVVDFLEDMTIYNHINFISLVYGFSF